MKKFIVTLFMGLMFCNTIQALPKCNKMIHWKKWKNCLGTMTYSNKDKYAGEWEDGRIYVGEFKADYLSEQGTMIYPDEMIKKGIWEFDKLVN